MDADQEVRQQRESIHLLALRACIAWSFNSLKPGMATERNRLVKMLGRAFVARTIAAALSEDGRLERYLKTRPGWPFVRRSTQFTVAA